MVYCMNIADLQTAQSNGDYADLFRGRPHRFVLPLRPKVKDSELNLVQLGYTNAKAFWGKSKKKIKIVSQRICDVGCETPTIYYEKYIYNLVLKISVEQFTNLISTFLCKFKPSITLNLCSIRHNGKKYRYFYSITSDVNDPQSAGQIHKVDTWSGNVTSWFEENSYCAEPMFVPNPGAESEDDGVILSSMIRAAPEVFYTALLVLDAKTMLEIGRAEFECPGPVAKPLHGAFTGNNVSSNKRNKIKA